MPGILANMRSNAAPRATRNSVVILRDRITITGNIASGGSAAAADHPEITCVYGGSTGLLTLSLPAARKGSLMCFVTSANVDGISATAWDPTTGAATIATKDGGVLTNLATTEFFDVILVAEDR
jgi:hypothetical protein